MSCNERLYLLVAGREQSGGQKPVSHYQKLADELGVQGRCRWDSRYIPQAEVGNYFDACDIVVLTYSAAFRSASGVLNAAVHYRRPCLVSSGQSNLKTVVEKFRLGRWVEPDDVESIVAGLQNWGSASLDADWCGYEQENSWGKNAQLVAAAMFENR
jgi:glycosyltransferase involved in cell wall biosynthesis